MLGAHFKSPSRRHCLSAWGTPLILQHRENCGGLFKANGRDETSSVGRRPLRRCYVVIYNWLSVAASAFDVAPWGLQTIDSRVGGNGSGATGHGPPVFARPSDNRRLEPRGGQRI